MSYLKPALCLSLLTIALASADTLKQGFEGPVFPPEGWTTYTLQSGLGEGGWMLGETGTEHYARGSANCYTPGGYYDTYFISPYQMLYAGNILTISFDVTLTESSGTEYPIIIMLRTKSALLWLQTKSLRLNQPTHLTYELPVITTPGYHHVLWHLSSSPLYTFTYVSVNIDNISLQRNVSANQTRMEPCSVGRIKSAYK
jgi:hypothetical protein